MRPTGWRRWWSAPTWCSSSRDSKPGRALHHTASAASPNAHLTAFVSVAGRYRGLNGQDPRKLFGDFCRRSDSGRRSQYLTADEWLTMVRKAGRVSVPPDSKKERDMCAVFNAIDLDNDGRVTIDELTAFVWDEEERDDEYSYGAEPEPEPEPQLQRRGRGRGRGRDWSDSEDSDGDEGQWATATRGRSGSHGSPRVAALRKDLLAEGLPVHGTIEQMVARLEDHMTAVSQQQPRGGRSPQRRGRSPSSSRRSPSPAAAQSHRRSPRRGGARSPTRRGRSPSRGSPGRGQRDTSPSSAWPTRQAGGGLVYDR